MIASDRYIPVFGTLMNRAVDHFEERRKGGEGHLCALWPLIKRHFREENDCFDKCYRQIVDPCCCSYFNTIFSCEPPVEVSCENEDIEEIVS